MEFRLLGSVAMVTEDGDVALGPAKRSSLLAVLLLRPNSAVNVGQLIDALWEEEPPVHAKTVLQGHVSRLRALLAEHGAGAYGVELATQGSAYVLRMPESLVDAHRFEELVGLAGVQRQPADAVRMLREALSYWQGPRSPGPSTAGPGGRRHRPGRAAAHHRGGAGAGVRAARRARQGRRRAAHRGRRPPLRESLAAALMLALGRSGRQSDAIDWYHRTRRLLAEELGVDPGETLAEAYATLLRSAEPAPWPAPSPRPPSSRCRRACPRRRAASPDAAPSWPRSTGRYGAGTGPSASSPAPPASARRPSPSTGRTSGAPASPTGVSSPI